MIASHSASYILCILYLNKYQLLVNTPIAGECIYMILQLLYYDILTIQNLVKGILHQKIFYGLNLIFWIVMGWGIARFGQRGLKTTET